MKFTVPSTTEPSDAKDRSWNELANTCTNRGIALLNHGTETSLTEAVRAFDDAIALRRKLPIEKNLLFRYGLTAGWMNRGDALTRLGGAKNLAEAVCCYDEAISLMSDMSINENPLFRSRLAIAWMNRGITLQNKGTQQSLAEAVGSFDQSILLMQGMSLSAHFEFRSTLACAWMNRGNTLLQISPSRNVEQARDSAKQSLAFSINSEESDLLLAEIGLKARHALCRSIGELLSKASSSTCSHEDLITEASDVVDGGMALARKWEICGTIQFRPLAIELFRFGGFFYLTYQPHFLAEFLSENLDAFPPESVEMHRVAADIISQAQRGLHTQGFTSMDVSEMNRWVQILRDLQNVRERLTHLSAKESQLNVSANLQAQ